MILTGEVEQNLNTRNYYLKETEVPISPVIVLPPFSPPTESGEGFIDRFGKLIVIGLVGMFFLAIYPENQGGGGQ